jgi:predicted RNase H-like HicB family nuclease
VSAQGDSVEEATANLREAVELFFECASGDEVKDRFASASSGDQKCGWAASA